MSEKHFIVLVDGGCLLCLIIINRTSLVHRDGLVKCLEITRHLHKLCIEICVHNITVNILLPERIHFRIICYQIL